MPKIKIQLATGAIEHALVEDTVTIGRAPDNALVIDDASVSSYHAQIIPADGGYILQDLGSTNGTRINGKSLAAEEKETLKSRDAIRFGRVESVYDPDNELGGEAREMPETNELVLEAAAKSAKPSNFMNASPFEKRAKQKDAAGVAGWVIAAIACLASLVAIAMSFTLKG